MKSFGIIAVAAVTSLAFAVSAAAHVPIQCQDEYNAMIDAGKRMWHPTDELAAGDHAAGRLLRAVLAVVSSREDTVAARSEAMAKAATPPDGLSTSQIEEWFRREVERINDSQDALLAALGAEAEVDIAVHETAIEMISLAIEYIRAAETAIWCANQ